MRNYIVLLLVLCTCRLFSQEITTNRNPVGMEHNILFNAKTRYSVTQTGSATLNLDMLFDGRFAPSYTSTAPSESIPTVILIEGLPAYHVQGGAWVGWSTRYWNTKRFKIEGYDVYYGNGWVTIADYSSQDYSGYEFSKKAPQGTFTKLRFTFYLATGTNGMLGVSELFYIHPEAMRPYQGLLEYEGNTWEKNGSNIYAENCNVGIGTTTPTNKLEVNGTIRSKEVKVEASPWPDFVFTEEHELPDLQEVNTYIQQNGHLPEIPTAQEVKENGISLGEMDAKLLQKIEELTLYVIDMNIELQSVKEENKILQEKINVLETKKQ